MRVLSDSLFVFIILVSVLFMLKAVNKDRPLLYLIGGPLMTVMAFIRPIALYLLPFLTVFFVLYAYRIKKCFLLSSYYCQLGCT
jgi:4-amino-4-deoxy-L-arabinose transferase-like glycosyltransferase